MCTSCSSWYEARNGTPHTFILRNLQLNKSMDLHVGSVFTQPQHVVIYTTSETKQNRTKLVWLVCYNNNYSLEQYIRRRQVLQSKSRSNAITNRSRERTSTRIVTWGLSWEMNTRQRSTRQRSEWPARGLDKAIVAAHLIKIQCVNYPLATCNNEQRLTAFRFDLHYKT